MKAEYAAPPLPHLQTLWFELLAGPIAWSLHLLIIYALSWAACVRGWHRIDALGISLWILAATIVTALAAAPVVLAAIWAWWNFRRLHNAQERQAASAPLYDRAARSRFMALLGLFLSAVSLLAIVKQFIPAVLFSPC